MNINKRLRIKMAEKGTAAAKKWKKERQENTRNFNPSEYENAKNMVYAFIKKA